MQTRRQSPSRRVVPAQWTALAGYAGTRQARSFSSNMALAFTQQAIPMSSLGGQTPKMWCCASPRFCPAILFEMDCIAIDDDHTARLGRSDVSDLMTTVVRTVKWPLLGRRCQDGAADVSCDVNIGYRRVSREFFLFFEGRYPEPVQHAVQTDWCTRLLDEGIDPRVCSRRRDSRHRNIGTELTSVCSSPNVDSGL